MLDKANQPSESKLSSSSLDNKQIYVALDELLTARNMTLSELANRVGITIANMSILKNNHAKAIRFSTLDAICRELDCSPGDILQRR